jgi:hypothetical protein
MALERDCGSAIESALPPAIDEFGERRDSQLGSFSSVIGFSKKPSGLHLHGCISKCGTSGTISSYYRMTASEPIDGLDPLFSSVAISR